ncbi:unnamed protein product, partial [Heligmosomoides polygyrus]|uniref:Thioredoxin domain-containing protein n=1 Tax=Heligmosomoides polygyrus TaxID=6339 RepID=A0A183G1C9_HELPZ
LAALLYQAKNEIDWVKWSNAIGVAKDLNKPIFFLIHKTWCGACSGLKREFKTSPKMSELIELSKKFVMVNVEDDEEPEDDKYAPDGGYIPRILFLDTDAEPMKTNNEAKYRNNKYFYPLVPQLIDAMQRALIEFEAKSTVRQITNASFFPELSKFLFHQQQKIHICTSYNDRIVNHRRNL